MIINHFYIICAQAVIPRETHTPALVDPYAPLASPVASQLFESVATYPRQVTKILCREDAIQFFLRSRLNFGRNRSHVHPKCQLFSELVLEAIHLSKEVPRPVYAFGRVAPPAPTKSQANKWGRRAALHLSAAAEAADVLEVEGAGLG